MYNFFKTINIDPTDRKELDEKTWKSQRVLVISTNVGLMLHVIYYIFFNTYLTENYKSINQIFFIFGLHPIITVAIICLSISNPKQSPTKTAFWNLLTSMNALLISFMLLLQSLLCVLNMEKNQPTCLTQVLTGTFTAYSVVGPIVSLIVYRTNRVYMTSAFGIFYFTYVAVMVVRAEIVDIPIAQWFLFIFILFSYFLAFLMNVNIEKSEVDNFNTNNQLITSIELQRLAQESEQLVTKRTTDFTNYIFHEIRVPLNVSNLSLNLLDDDYEFKNKLNTEQYDNINRIKEGLSSVEIIINDTLDFNKMRDGKFTLDYAPFSLLKLIYSTMWATEISWKTKNINLQIDLDKFIQSDEYDIVTDAIRLKQILLNFVGNAIKFTPKGKQINIVARTVFGGPLQHGIEAKLNIKVEDEGVGISDENQKKLFSDFVQISNSLQKGKGSGLGLKIVSNIVKNMNGKCGVNSKIGKGSAFWIEIPILLSSKSKVDYPSLDMEKRSVDIDLGDKRVLFGDDDMNSRAIFQRLFTKLGFTIDCVSNAEEAIAESEKRNYDLIILDNNMPPYMNGVDALQIINKRYKGLGIDLNTIIISGDNLLEESFPSDFRPTFVLHKPTNIKEIKKIVNDIFNT